MGLNKYIELDNGVEASYWRVETVKIEASYVRPDANSPIRNIVPVTDELGVVVAYVNHECVCSVALYKDHAAREAGKDPIKSVFYSWVGPDSPFISMGNQLCPVSSMYDKLKTLPEFADATDL